MLREAVWVGHVVSDLVKPITRKMKPHVLKKADSRPSSDRLDQVKHDLSHFSLDRVSVGSYEGNETETNRDPASDELFEIPSDEYEGGRLREVEHKDDVVEIASDQVHRSGIGWTQELLNERRVGVSF